LRYKIATGRNDELHLPEVALKMVDDRAFFVVSGFPWNRIQQFREEAIGEGTFGQIRREIRSRTR